MSQIRHTRRKISSGCTFLFALAWVATAAAWQSSAVYYGSDGKLEYWSDTEGNRIPDFSHAGYHEGEKSIPHVPVKKTISPVSGDNRSHIQSAINEVGTMSPDANGHRGAVMLNPGTYELTGTITISKSGVVLRGSGMGTDPSSNTILKRTSSGGTVVEAAGSVNWTTGGGVVSGTQTDITTNRVQVGERLFTVANASPFSVGDNVIIRHPPSAAWLDAIDGGGTAGDAGWNVNDKEMHITYNRIIEAISGNSIAVNAPVFNHLDRSLSQSFIYKYNRTGLLREIGLENFRVDGSDVDEAIIVRGVEHGWIDGVSVLYFDESGFRIEGCTYITCRNSEATEPRGERTGGHFYNFRVQESQMVLVHDCFSSEARHAFICNGKTQDAGNVFVDCRADKSTTFTEVHRRWGTGILFDNIVHTNSGRDRNISFALMNRGDWGTAHGWSTAHSVLWNCDAGKNSSGGYAECVVQKPPTGQNWAIGCKTVVNGDGPFYKDLPGFIEGTNSDGLEPRSLYYAQLSERTGKTQAPRIVTDQLPKVSVGNPYSMHLVASGGTEPIEWSLLDGALPPGISLTSGGILSGTYTGSAISFSPVIQIQDGNGQTDTKTFTLSVYNSLFSDIETYGDAQSWNASPVTAWDVVDESGDPRYAITIEPTPTSGDGLGAISIIKDESFADFSMSFKGKSTASGAADFAAVFGYQDKDNYYYVIFNATAEYSQFFAVENGTRSLITTINRSLIPDANWHDYTVERSATSITVLMDGTEVLSTSDDRFGSGKIGLGAYNDPAMFDDVSVGFKTPLKQYKTVAPAKPLSVSGRGRVTINVPVDKQYALSAFSPSGRLLFRQRSDPGALTRNSIDFRTILRSSGTLILVLSIEGVIHREIVVSTK